jgi:hypothetical protein
LPLIEAAPGVHAAKARRIAAKLLPNLIWIKQRVFAIRFHLMHDRGRFRKRFRTNPLRLRAVACDVATVWIIWLVLEKINPDEVADIRTFLTFIIAVVSVCDAHLQRTGNRDARRDDGCIGWFAVLAFGVILAGDLCWRGFLYRPNSVAMVALA